MPGRGASASFGREAEKRGLDPNVWFGNVEQIASERIGRETVTYVSNIYKYYVAYRLLVEERDAARRRQGVIQVGEWCASRCAGKRAGQDAGQVKPPRQALAPAGGFTARSGLEAIVDVHQDDGQRRTCGQLADLPRQSPPGTCPCSALR